MHSKSISESLGLKQRSSIIEGQSHKQAGDLSKSALYIEPRDGLYTIGKGMLDLGQKLESP